MIIWGKPANAALFVFNQKSTWLSLTGKTYQKQTKKYWNVLCTSVIKAHCELMNGTNSTKMQANHEQTSHFMCRLKMVVNVLTERCEYYFHLDVRMNKMIIRRVSDTSGLPILMYMVLPFNNKVHADNGSSKKTTSFCITVPQPIQVAKGCFCYEL